MLQVLRFCQRGRHPLHMPLPMLTKATPLGVLLPAVGIGALVGAFIRAAEGIGWIFALLILCAMVTAIAQQTLP